MDTRGLATLLEWIGAGLVVMGIVIGVVVFGVLRVAEWWIGRGGR